ncbi:MAG: type IV pilus secretin PilQ [Bdellovibrionota bacterium]
MSEDTMLRKSYVTQLWMSTVLVALVACGGKTPPSSVEDAPTVSPENAENLFDQATVDQGPGKLVDISVNETDQNSLVTLVGTKPMSPNIFQLTEPDRIIVDLTDTTIGEVAPSKAVNGKIVGEIKVEQFDDDRSSLSRVEISLNLPSEYQVVTDGNSLSLQIGSFGATDSFGDQLAESFGVVPTQQPAEATPLEDQVFPVGDESPMDAMSQLTQEGQSTGEIADINDFQDPFAANSSETSFDQTVGSLGTAPGQQAKKLVDINYGLSEEGTIITIMGDGNIEKYEHFILEDPKRVVVDFPGLTNSYQGANSVSINTEEVKEVRIGETEGNVRVVLDLKNAGQTQYMVDPLNSTLMITIPSAAAVASLGKNQPAPVVEESAPVVIDGFGEDTFAQVPSLEETQQQEVVSPEPETGTLESFDSFQDPGAPVFDVAADTPAPSATIDAVAFTQTQDQTKSKFTISTNNPNTVYDIVESPNGLNLVVRNSKLGSSILSRQIITQEFATAVDSINPSHDKKSNDTTFGVALNSNVNYQSYKEGNNIVLEVDVPAGQVAKVNAPVGGSAPTGNELVLDATSLGDSIANGNKSVGIGVEEQKLGLAPETVKKDYRYVNESFMSDSLGDDTPLSQMGAILSGQLNGRQFTGRKISLDFKDADIRSIFRLISDISKFNLIISDDVSGRVTIRLDDVPWDQAFAIILQSKGLWFEKYGNIVRVAPAKKLQEEKEAAAAAERATQAVKPLDILFKPVSFAQAATLTKQVGTILSERGSVDIDSRTNTLIIKDIRENLDKARKMVDILDTQTPQVSIEARIVEATTTFTRSFGITWTGNTRFTAATGNPTGLYFPNSVAVTPFALNFPVDGGFINSTANVKLGSINNVLDLDLALAIGEQKGFSKLISAPKVTVLDNKQATITAGSRIPFLTQTANAGSNVRFENAATSLSVTPHITNDGSILMDITATRNEPNFAQLVQGNPLIDQRTAITEVLVKSGNTTVLGGIYSTRTGRSISRFPFLSSIPIFGALFRNYDKQLSRTELLIFVTPRIVGDEREAIRDVRE